jgi:antitoxin PrlF
MEGVTATMITSTMTSKGQITVPKKIREFLGVGDSDKISFTPLEDGKVILSVEHPSAKILFGMLSKRQRQKPVSIEEMEAAIVKRRLQRGAK